MATPSSFIKPRGEAAKAGPKAWLKGQRLWDMHVHQFKILARNLGVVVTNSEGLSNAGTLGLKSPELTFDVEAFAKDALRADRSELINRPDIGVSMAVGTLAALKVNLSEGQSHGFFHPKFVSEFASLCDQFDLQKMNEALNIHDFPDVDRSEADIQRAAKDLLKFSSAVKDLWPKYADCLGRLAGAFIGVYTAMTLGACVLPGTVAAAVADVPLDAELKDSAAAAKSKLLANPASATALSDFVTALVWARHSNAKKKSAIKSGGHVPASRSSTLTFSPTPVKIDRRRCLKECDRLVAALQGYDVTSANASADDIKAKAQRLHELAAELHAADSSFEGALSLPCIFACKLSGLVVVLFGCACAGIPFDIRAMAKKLLKRLKERDMEEQVEEEPQEEKVPKKRRTEEAEVAVVDRKKKRAEETEAVAGAAKKKRKAQAEDE